MLQRSLLLSLLLFGLSACCATPLPDPDFSSPVATLGTFQGAFNSDEKGADLLGYECFSQDFKDRNGRFDLDMYSMLRRKALEESPFLSFLMSLKDLTDCITNVDSPLNGNADLALMALSIAGQDLEILFVRETSYELEYERDERIKGRRTPSIASMIEQDGETLVVRLDGLSKSWIRALPRLRRILVEGRWKFADIKILQGDGEIPQL